MNTSKFSDPKLVGPGVWFKMHLDAVISVSDESKKHFILSIENLAKNFKCLHCKDHFREFINKHPFHLYWNIYDAKGRDIGFFKWSWECHNNVNRFLNKYQPSLEEAYEYYSDQNIGACTNCGHPAISDGDPPRLQASLPPRLQSALASVPVDNNPVKIIDITNVTSTKNFRLLPRAKNDF